MVWKDLRSTLMAATTCFALTDCALIEGGPRIADNVWLMRPNVTDTTVDPNYTPAACPKTEAEADGDDTSRKDFTKGAAIDTCIFAWINLIDVRYMHFEQQLFGSTTNSNFWADTAVLGISGAGAFFSGGAAQVMNGVTAGITGAKSKFDQDILYSKTISVLIQQMRNDRSDALNIILKRVNATQGTKLAATQTVAAQSATAAASQAATTAAQAVSSAVQASVSQPGATTENVTRAANDAAQSAPAAAAAAAAPATAMPYTSMYQAAIDLHNYAIAGSWSHALIQMETDTAANAAAAKDAVTATKTGTAPN